MIWTQFVGTGSILGALAVMFGAFGAHALKGKLSPEYLEIFETAVRYQMYHALALVAVGLVATRIEANILKAAGVSFFLGTVVFSGSLYVLTLTGIKWLGMVTPFGGLLLIAGWVALAVAAFTVAV